MLDSSPPLDRRHKNFSKSVLQLMEKIPEEAESLTVMVGGVNFLQKPVVAFVRLAQVKMCARVCVCVCVICYNICYMLCKTFL